MAAKTHKNFLRFLADVPLRQLKSLVKTFSRSQVKAIREVVFNVLRGQVKLTPETKKALQPYKKFLRQLAYKGVKKCKLNRNCRVLLNVLKAAKDTVESL